MAERTVTPGESRLRSLLPWHDPKRQAVTTGWWGWFPNIPRNVFGRVCWTVIVGGVSLAFGAFATVLLVGFFMNPGSVTSSGDLLLTLVIGFLLLPGGCLIFAWHLVNGIALARAEDEQARVLRAETAAARAHLLEARARLTGRHDPLL